MLIASLASKLDFDGKFLQHSRFNVHSMDNEVDHSDMKLLHHVTSRDNACKS